MIPANNHHTRDKKGPEPTTGIAGRFHVLVLDDDPALRELFGMMLDRVGCRASICSSSQEAIEAYRAAHAGTDNDAIHCALIDLHIDEKIDGVGVSQILRDINPAGLDRAGK